MNNEALFCFDRCSTPTAFVRTRQVPLVLLLGAAYHRATGIPWAQSLLKIHAIVHRQPGANMVSEKSIGAWAVINVVRVMGVCDMMGDHMCGDVVRSCVML